MSPVRAAVVTGGLAVAGAVAGGITAIVFALLFNLAVTGRIPLNREAFFPGIVGGALGLLLGPTLAWGFMRRVPLGAAILATSVGAGLGAAVGAVLIPLFPNGPGGILGLVGGSLSGAVLGALWARRRWSNP